jgi:hypothetical protein
MRKCYHGLAISTKKQSQMNNLFTQQKQKQFSTKKINKQPSLGKKHFELLNFLVMVHGKLP